MSTEGGIHRRENSQLQQQNQSILSSYSLRQNYREQINESMNSDISSIAKFSDFKDKLIEAKTIKNTEKGMINMKLFDKLAILRKISFVLLLILAFFERPIWCTIDYHDYCRLSPNKQTQIPTSNIPYLNSYIFYPIEIIIVCFLTYNRHLKQTFLKSSKHRYQFYVLLIITIIIVIEDIVKSFVEAYGINISLFLKPIYFASFNRTLRKTVQIYLKIIKKALPILTMIAFNIIFFAVLGRIIFYNQQNNDFFDSFFDSWFNFTVLLTTSNFPDVMMPYYNEHRWAPLFFMCFLILNLILLLNTTLAVFYSNYKMEMEKDTKKFFLKNKEQIHEYIHNFIATSNYRVLTKQNQQLLSSFMKLQVKKELLQSRPESLKFSDQIKDINDSPVKNFILQIYKSKQWNIFMGCLSLLNFSILYVMTPSLANQTDLSEWATINICINLVFFLEQLTILIILKKRYLRIKKYYIFDLVVSVIVLCLILSFYITQEGQILPYCMFLICTRFVRFIFILFKFESFKTIFQTVYDFIPLFVNLFGVLIFMFFIYAALGQHIFGGKMTYDFEQEINKQTNTQYYVLNSFNDTATSLVLLFELLIVNNWMVNVQVHQIIMGTRNVRYFFIVWYVISVVICMNIMVAFIIDHLVPKLNSESLEDQVISEYFDKVLKDAKQGVQGTQSMKFSIFSSKSEDDLQHMQNSNTQQIKDLKKSFKQQNEEQKKDDE